MPFLIKNARGEVDYGFFGFFEGLFARVHLIKFPVLTLENGFLGGETLGFFLAKRVMGRDGFSQEFLCR
jgi:hypothetical protein